MQEMYENASQVATDAVGSIRTVASFCAEKRVVATYNEKCGALRKQGIRSGIVGGLGFGFSFLIMYLAYGLCFYVGAQFIRQGKTTFPDVFKVRYLLILSTIQCTDINNFINHSQTDWMVSRFSSPCCWQLLGFHRVVHWLLMQQRQGSLLFPFSVFWIGSRKLTQVVMMGWYWRMSLAILISTMSVLSTHHVLMSRYSVTSPCTFLLER
jgi:hypothetical protein